MRLIKIAVYLLLVGFVFGSTPALAEEEFKPFQPPGKFINLGMHVMYVDCLGEKSPTVLIDVGLADSSANWYTLAKRLSKNVRTCVYDRAGYGWSDPGPGNRTTAQIVHELNMLTEFAEIPGPYVIVGHSFGGFTARYFASTYPDKTAGVVLIDSSHPDQIVRLAELDKTNKSAPLKVSRREPAPDTMTEFEKRWFFLNSSRKATFAQMNELKGFKKSAHEVKNSAPFPDIPLAVLTRGKELLPVLHGVYLEQEWREMQKDLLNLSDKSWQVIVKDSGHNIYKDAPDEIIDNILKVVALTKNE
jgi:pimeloyl-ACP methyl ester carboxylesterase